MDFTHNDLTNMYLILFLSTNVFFDCLIYIYIYIYENIITYDMGKYHLLTLTVFQIL